MFGTVNPKLLEESESELNIPGDCIGKKNKTRKKIPRFRLMKKKVFIYFCIVVVIQ